MTRTGASVLARRAGLIDKSRVQQRTAGWVPGGCLLAPSGSIASRGGGGLSRADLGAYLQLVIPTVSGSRGVFSKATDGSLGILGAGDFADAARLNAHRDFGRRPSPRR